MATQVKVVVFDIGDVLYRYQGCHTSLAKRLQLPENEYLRIWWSMDTGICQGVTPLEQLWEELKKKAHYTGPDIDLPQYWVKHFYPIQEVHDLILSKLAGNYELVLLSNIYPEVVPLALENGCIPAIPWTHFLSCDWGMTKPDPRFFQLVSNELGVNGYEVLFIDDKEENIKAAYRTCFWNVITFDPEHSKESVNKIMKILGI